MKSSKNSFLTDAEILNLDFKSIGKFVKISRNATIYNANKIEIGDFTRIDDFCVLSAGEGGIKIGKNVHIAVYSCLIGKAYIEVGDYANISSRVSIYSTNDDYSGEYMTNPTIDSKYTNVYSAAVKVGQHVIIGSGSVVLPGVILAEGACLGALSFVNKNCDSYCIYGGIPIKFIKKRSQGLKEKFEQKNRDENINNK
jgi:acetyltransferase-like isoleucine patch superfamily enzyme